MRIGLTTDTKQFEKAMRDAKMGKRDTKRVLQAGAKTVANKQRELVPVDEGDTKRSIQVFDVGDHLEVGPTTPYAPVIEYGDPTRPGYPIQPFVRPSYFGREHIIQGQMTKEVNAILREKGLT